MEARLILAIDSRNILLKDSMLHQNKLIINLDNNNKLRRAGTNHYVDQYSVLFRKLHNNTSILESWIIECSMDENDVVVLVGNKGQLHKGGFIQENNNIMAV